MFSTVTTKNSTAEKFWMGSENETLASVFHNQDGVRLLRRKVMYEAEASMALLLAWAGAITSMV